MNNAHIIADRTDINIEHRFVTIAKVFIYTDPDPLIPVEFYVSLNSREDWEYRCEARFDFDRRSICPIENYDINNNLRLERLFNKSRFNLAANKELKIVSDAAYDYIVSFLANL